MVKQTWRTHPDEGLNGAQPNDLGKWSWLSMKGSSLLLTLINFEQGSKVDLTPLKVKVTPLKE